MFRCMPQGGPGEPRCTVHGCHGARCRRRLPACHAGPAHARRAMPRRPACGACHAGPCPGGLRAALPSTACKRARGAGEVAWPHAMPAPAHALARSPGRMPRRPQPMRRGRLAACHDAPAHARRGSAGRCARGLAMSSGRGRLAMARPARPVRAHGAADVGRVRLSARPRPWARHRPRHVVGHHSDPERQRNRSEIL